LVRASLGDDRARHVGCELSAPHHVFITMPSETAQLLLELT